MSKTMEERLDDKFREGVRGEDYMVSVPASHIRAFVADEIEKAKQEAREEFGERLKISNHSTYLENNPTNELIDETLAEYQKERTADVIERIDNPKAKNIEPLTIEDNND